MDNKPKPSLNLRPDSLTKSNSTVSVGGRSTRSHDSVSVLGVHPLGTLRVHDAADEPQAKTINDDDGDDGDDAGPPPLEPASAKDQQQHGSIVPAKDAAPRQGHPATATPRDLQAHDLGGGDMAVVIELPDIFTIGYDCVSVTVKDFIGLRDMPRGAHFLWAAHPSGVAARSGVWLLNPGSQDHVHVVQWDNYHESLAEATRSESRNRADSIRDVYSRLLPYRDPTAGTQEQTLTSPQDNWAMWQQLTRHITKDLLDRISGHQTGGWVVHTLDRIHGSADKTIAAEVALERAIPNKNLQVRELNFSFVQETPTYSAETFGAQRSLDALDPTTYLLALINNPNYGLVGDDLVGELQFCYVVGMHLGNDACIQQWWYMVLKLVIKAHQLVAARPVLVGALLRTLAAQLTHSSEWLDSSILDYAESHCQELRVGLIVYKRRMDECLHSMGNTATPDHVAVATAFARLESVVADRGWDLSGEYLRRGNVMMEDGEQVELEMDELEAEDERGEWAPEVVELDEHGRQRDLVSWND